MIASYDTIRVIDDKPITSVFKVTRGLTMLDIRIKHLEELLCANLIVAFHVIYLFSFGNYIVPEFLSKCNS